MEKLLIIDCHAIGHQVKHKLKGLSKDIVATGVIFGFFRQVKVLARKFDTRNFFFCWDSKKSLRKRIYPSYKMRKERELTPEELELELSAREQFTELYRCVLPKFGFRNNILVTGYEADDLIASVVLSDANNRYEKVVVSRDEDLYQLLGECTMWNTFFKKMITDKDLYDEFGIKPHNWALVKALAGCDGDTVAGIKGIGEILAARYIRGELKKHSVAYKKIEAAKDAVLERNIPIVSLPFPGLDGRFDFSFRGDAFDRGSFLDIIDKYDFRMFRKELEEWATLFAMN